MRDGDGRRCHQCSVNLDEFGQALEVRVQLIGAYTIFLLTMTALGLGTIFCGMIEIALYEGAAWFRAAHPIAVGVSAKSKEFNLRRGRQHRYFPKSTDELYSESFPGRRIQNHSQINRLEVRSETDESNR